MLKTAISQTYLDYRFHRHGTIPCKLPDQPLPHSKTIKQTHFLFIIQFNRMHTHRVTTRILFYRTIHLHIINMWHLLILHKIHQLSTSIRTSDGDASCMNILIRPLPPSVLDQWFAPLIHQVYIGSHANRSSP